jgi:hypothetical protein
MKIKRTLAAGIVGSALAALGAHAGVTPQEAEQLGTTLTPTGAEKAGNKDGSIPAWDGGYTKQLPGFTNGGRRDQDPFAAEKPLYTVTAQNMAQYADKLSEGSKAMLKKYPDYRIDVYPTHRTSAAPQWVYDNIKKNAVRASLSPQGLPQGAYGGVPFPIPKNGTEVMWNHLLRWMGTDRRFEIQSYLRTASGDPVMVVDASVKQSLPFYHKGGSPETFDGYYWYINLVNIGPPLRAGEAVVGRTNIAPEKDISYVYLPGQRRTRKLPNACCDTPASATAGVMTFDEQDVFLGRLDKFDWKLKGKKELLIPYNTNKSLKPTNALDLMKPKFLNPDHVRWELHRVWVVEATLKQGARHVAPKGVYYIDEDSWAAVLGDRWDANGQLWKTMWQLPVLMPDVPVTTAISYGFYDLVQGTWFANNLVNAKKMQYEVMPRYAPQTFTAEALTSDGVR